MHPPTSRDLLKNYGIMATHHKEKLEGNNGLQKHTMA